MGVAAEMRHGCRASAFAAVNPLHLVRTLASEPQPVRDRVIAGNEWCKLAPNLPFALGSTNDQLGWIPVPSASEPDALKSDIRFVAWFGRRTNPLRGRGAGFDVPVVARLSRLD